jgi:hypothetical protein
VAVLTVRAADCWPSKQLRGIVNARLRECRKKTGRRTIPPAGQPSSTRGLTTRIVEPKPIYMREPLNVAGASGDGVAPYVNVPVHLPV